MTEEDYAGLVRVQQRAYELRQEIASMKRFLEVATECDTISVCVDAGINEAHCGSYFPASGATKQAVLTMARHRLNALCQEFEELPSAGGGR